ncbi:transporter [Hymenobacter cellulosilyticus]|uniref:Transporter n=1 Tax=Hymenobacter cellulosilyticus TaxID=2932248 RepID=A0A8T9QB84_9BACT|nr:transporter [Hymenobacter cellulosilyticus]UOQ74767.1 transporter [Hymenobacter cellulosilyticus]
MKQIYLTLALLGLMSSAARACDICGCFMGITPYDNQSGVSLMHRYRIFNGYQALGQRHAFFPAGVQPFVPSQPNHDNGYEHSHQGDATDYEAYRVLELRGKYFLAQRLEINAFVPYVMNTSQSNGRQLNTAGLGDATVFAGYHLIRAIETAGVQSRLIVGGGAKLPTGDYRRTNPRGSATPCSTSPVPAPPTALCI